jgi:hypothetical protein
MGAGSHAAESLCCDQIRFENSYFASQMSTKPPTSNTGVTEADVKLLLAEEEAELAANGVVALNEVNASAFVVAGLDLQDRQ